MFRRGQLDHSRRNSFRNQEHDFKLVSNTASQFFSSASCAGPKSRCRHCSREFQSRRAIAPSLRRAPRHLLRSRRLLPLRQSPHPLGAIAQLHLLAFSDRARRCSLLRPSGRDLAIANPIPRLPPVTSAVFPARGLFVSMNFSDEATKTPLFTILSSGRLRQDRTRLHSLSQLTGGFNLAPSG